jgi:hypothetical protein
MEAPEVTGLAGAAGIGAPAAALHDTNVDAVETTVEPAAAPESEADSAQDSEAVAEPEQSADETDADDEALAQTEEPERSADDEDDEQENDEAREAARREREEAKEAARREREESKAAARDAKAAHRAEKKAAKDADRIVEAPREPKVSFLDRRRQKAAAGEPGSRVGARNVVAVLAVAIGVLGLVCSLILAVGAFMAALGTTDSNGAYDTLSSLCDVLVGPLRDVFSFSGTNAEMKESVISWGAGSMIYVLVGMFAQSYLRSRVDDD